MQSSLFFLHDDISPSLKTKIKEKKYDRSRQKPPHNFLSPTKTPRRPSLWFSAKQQHSNFLYTRKFLGLIHTFSPQQAQSWLRILPARSRSDVLSWCLYHISSLYSKTQAPHHEAWFDFIVRNVKRCHNIRSFHENLSLTSFQKMVHLFSKADRIWLIQESVRRKNRNNFLWWAHHGHIPSGALLSSTFLTYEQNFVDQSELVDIFKHTTSFRSGFMFLLYKGDEKLLDFYASQPHLTEKELTWALKTSEDRGFTLPAVKALVQKKHLEASLLASCENVKSVLWSNEESRVRKI